MAEGDGDGSAVGTPRQETHSAEAATLITAELVRTGVKVVPMLYDSWFKHLFRELEREDRLTKVGVFSEVEGVGICCGAYFGGVGSSLVMANAGFLLCTYHLPTLAMMHRIPLFMLISYRGRFGDSAFFQEYQGLFTTPIMDIMGIQYTLVESLEDISKIGDAYRYSRQFRRPAAVLLTKPVLV